MADALTVSQLEDLARFAYEQGDVERARKRLAQADALKASEAQERGTFGEAGYAGGAGVVRGAAEVAQLGPTILDFMQAGLPAMIAEKVFGAEPTERVKGPTIPEQIGEVTGGYSEYRSPTTLGQYAGTVGEFAGGAAALPIGGVARSVGSAILPAIASETAGQAAATYAPEYESLARLAGAIGAPLVTESAKSAGRKLLAGEEARLGRAGSERARSIAALEEAGVPLTAGQKLGSVPLMRMEGVEATDLSTLEGISKQMMNLMGSSAPKATRSAMLERKTTLGDVFERAEAIAGGVPAQADVDNMVKVAQRFQDASGDPMPRIVKEAIERIDEATSIGKPLSAEMLSDFRTRLSDVIETTMGDERAVAAMGAKEVIDNIIERSVKGKDPELYRELVKAREQYRAFLTGMRALNRQGTDTRGGIISPKALSAAARIREGTKFLTGTGSPLGEFAFAAEEIASSLPAVIAGGGRGVRGAAGGLGALVGAQTGLEDAILGAALGYGAPKVLQAAIRSGPVQRGIMPPEATLQSRLLERLGRQTGGLLAID
jgi:hypothetical protein